MSLSTTAPTGDGRPDLHECKNPATRGLQRHGNPPRPRDDCAQIPAGGGRAAPGSRGDAQRLRGTREILPDAEVAAEEDWYREYLDLILSVRVVRDLDEAIAHIEKYGSLHTEAIVTEATNGRSAFSARSIPPPSSSTPPRASATASNWGWERRSVSARPSSMPSDRWGWKN